MTKVIKATPKAPKSGEVGKKIVRSSTTGQFVTFRTVDAESKTFAGDLSRAFKKNVEAALRRKK